MQTPGPQISRQHNPTLRIPKQLIIPQPRLFTQLTMQRNRRYSLRIKKIFQLMKTTDSITKNHRFLFLPSTKFFKKRLMLVIGVTV